MSASDDPLEVDRHEVEVALATPLDAMPLLARKTSCKTCFGAVFEGENVRRRTLASLLRRPLWIAGIGAMSLTLAVPLPSAQNRVANWPALATLPIRSSNPIINGAMPLGSPPPGVKLPGPISAPVPIYKPEPPYPEKARRARYSGDVILMILVDAEGNVADAQIFKSVERGLDESALETVRRWKFKPAVRDGVPIPVRVPVIVPFRLD